MYLAPKNWSHIFKIFRGTYLVKVGENALENYIYILCIYTLFGNK